MELYTEVVKDICDNRMVSAFVKFLARGGYLFFKCYFKLGKKMFDFLMVGSTTILFGVNPLCNVSRFVTSLAQDFKFLNNCYYVFDS
jgi:hypothetical protein